MTVEMANIFTNALAWMMGLCFAGVGVLYALLYMVIRMCGGRLPWWPKDTEPVRSISDYFKGFI